MADVLASLHLRAAQSTGLEASGAWSVAVAPYAGLKFNALVRGQAWLRVGTGQALRLEQGDCFLLAGGAPFVIASDLALAPVPAREVFADAADGVGKRLGRIGTGEEVAIVAGRMEADAAFAPLLADSLPPVTLVKADAPRADTVRWLLQGLAKESAAGAPAGRAVAARMVELLFIELLRAAMEAPDNTRGWLAALADRRMARVLHALHADPTRPWTLAELAGLAHMSRSTFAEAFRALVGIAPFQYLQRWRLHVAGDALRHRHASVSAAAALAGYASDSAFVSAFRRLYGCTPARYAAGESGA